MFFRSEGSDGIHGMDWTGRRAWCGWLTGTSGTSWTNRAARCSGTDRIFHWNGTDRSQGSFWLSRSCRSNR